MEEQDHQQRQCAGVVSGVRSPAQLYHGMSEQHGCSSCWCERHRTVTVWLVVAQVFDVARLEDPTVLQVHRVTLASGPDYQFRKQSDVRWSRRTAQRENTANTAAGGGAALCELCHHGRTTAAH